MSSLDVSVESAENLRYRPRNVFLVSDQRKNEPPPKFRTYHDKNVWIVKVRGEERRATGCRKAV